MYALSAPRFAVVIVTYNSAAHVAGTLAALTTQLADGDEVLVVDNGSADGTLVAVRSAGERVRVHAAEANLGFAAGCNLGAAHTSAPLLLFLNPDAAPAPGCIAALRATAAARVDWGAWQPLVTLPGEERVNTSGGITHYLGFGWSGGHDEPTASVGGARREVSFASGAALVVRRAAWERVGGFDPTYFMYGEDLDLSLRLWLAGYGVGLEPAARVAHDYEFSKGAQKWFLLERNRWRTVLGAYPPGLLWPLLPALLLFELALLPFAARAGWLGAKLRAQLAVARSLPALLRRRRAVQALRVVSAAGFAERLTDSLDSPFLGDASRLPALVRLQAAYWAGVVGFVNARRAAAPELVAR